MKANRPTSTELRVLIVEDNEDDATLVARTLRSGGYEPILTRVEDAAAMEAELGRARPDVVISDFSLPRFDGETALRLIRERGEDLPFIVVSGTITEEAAASIMRAGAHDYVLKGNLKRLVPAVERELREAEERAQRRKASLAAAAANARHDALITHLPVALVVSQGGLVTFVNSFFERMLGYAREQVIGIPPSSFARDDGENWLHANGSVVAVDVSEYSVDLDGELAQVVLARDLTEQKRAERGVHAAEKKFRTLVSSLDAFVFLLDQDARYEALFGRPVASGRVDAQQFLTKRPVDILGVETGMIHEAANRRALGGEGSSFEWTTDVGGPRRHFETLLSPLRDEADEVCGAVGVTRDVTTQVELHARILMTDRLAAIGTLAASVAHEINNPLAAVVANIEYLHEAVPPILSSATTFHADIIEAITDVREASNRVREIVRDLRVFSRGGDGEPEVSQPVDVEAAMEASLRMSQAALRDRARVVRDYGGVPPVRANTARLGQVFLNLLINAAQAIPPGNAQENEIRIRTRVEAGEVAVCVQDSGTGIAPELLPRLFEPFVTTKPEGEGTGLGLSISRQIVTALGGRIDVESRQGEGTTFCVRLPAETPH